MKNKAAQKLGRLGGLSTKKKYGKEHYQKLAANMNKKRWGNRKTHQQIGDYLIDYPSKGFVFDTVRRTFHRPETPDIRYPEKEIANPYFKEEL